MKKLISALLFIAVTLLYTQPSYAHVLVTDTSNTKGAILHITPDDDPVAGKKSTLYFDMQDQLDKDSSVTLTISNSAGQTSVLRAATNNTLATINYIFPSQGVYELTFTVKNGDKTYTFKQSQRVSRGTTLSPLTQPYYPWAEALLVASGVGLAMLLIIAFNRKKDIARYSTF